jgi:serine/threonine protein phosphatase PrpC
MSGSRAAPLRVGTALASARRASEDRLLVEERPHAILVAVADGAGGLVGGARAAELFVGLVRESMPALVAATTTAAFQDLLLLADKQIASDPSAGETTGIVLVVTRACIIGASVGDSEAWVVTDDAVDVVTERQTRRRLGTGGASPTAFDSRFVDGKLIVGTDGLFAYADQAQIAHVLRSCELRACAEKLIALVRLRSERFADDVAVVVVG